MAWSDVIGFGSFTVISSILYIYVLVVILRHRVLREVPFYMLNVAMGVVDIGNIWIEYLFHRLPALGVFRSVYLGFGLHNPFAVMCTCGFMFFNTLQKFLLIAISVNRFTAVVIPQYHKKIWSMRSSLLVIAILTIINFIPAAGSEVFVGSYYKEHQNDTDEDAGFGCKMTDWKYQMISLEINAYFCMFSAISVFLLYACIVFALSVNRKNLSNKSGVNTFRTELKLTISVLLHTLLLVVDGVTTALIFVWGQYDFIIVNMVIQDLLSGCNPYLLLFFSSSLRVKVLWFLHKPQSTTVTVSNKVNVSLVKAQSGQSPQVEHRLKVK